MTKCKPILWLFPVLLLFVAVSCNESRLPRELIVGGDNVVMILDFENSTDSVKQVIWQLNTFDIPNMPDTMIRRMKTVDDHKSVYYDEKTGHLIYTKGEISWWTHNIYCLNPDKTIIIPEINVYKVRVIK